MPDAVTVADRLRQHAAARPNQPALVEPAGGGRWTSISYAELNRRVDQYARGFVEKGIERGDRVLFLVRPGVDFYAALFGLFRMGAIPVLMDPGMGRDNLLQCIAEAKPRVILALPIVHVLRTFRGAAFRSAEVFITKGMRWWWGGHRLDQCLSDDDSPYVDPEGFVPEDEGFIAFTSGSTGPPKGVSFRHRMFVHQAELLGEVYGIGPDDITVECFTAFVIYDLALGMTTVLADMDMSKPATADPAKVHAALTEHKATTSFASPVVWTKLVRWAEKSGAKLPHLRRVLTAGAPIPPDLHTRFRTLLSDGVELYCPYGATEALPVATAGSELVLGETAAKTAQGAGICVGRVFPRVTVEIVRITDEPLPEWSDELRVPQGEVGEIAVFGPVASPEYKDRPDANAVSKVLRDGAIGHRMGDLGYLDDQGRLWFCGRKSHALHTADGLVPVVPVEQVFNAHPDVLRTALVGVGEPGAKVPVLCVELEAGKAWSTALRDEIEAAAEGTRFEGLVGTFLPHPGFPTDPRHNSKIKRDELRTWASQHKREAE